jgi:soluble epoxide hydrolase / lipid-phosphate phosphatase
MLNVAYSLPTGPFDLEAMLKFFKQTFGQGLYYYWRLFTSDEGPSILNAHLESLFTALHAKKLDHMKDTFATEDGMKNYLLADTRQELAAYATPEMQREFVARFQRDGFAAPLQWYRAVTENVHWGVEQKIPGQRLKVTVPALFVACTHDNVCLPVLIQQSVQAGLLPDLVVRELDSSHWSPFEKPEELGAVVREWLDGNFGGREMMFAGCLEGVLKTRN